MDSVIGARPNTSTVLPLPARPPNDRRRSLPTSPGHGRTGPRSANSIRNQPASPEVISSLIDSLSTISAPAHQHFENLPSIHGASASTPASPRIGSFDMSSGGSFGVEYGKSRLQSGQSVGQLPGDDGAEPPVVRMAKPPSGHSPLTATKLAKSGSSGSLRKNFCRLASRSQTSLNSVQVDHNEGMSLDNASVDTPIKRQSSLASRESHRGSSESRSRSRDGVRGLFYKNSRDRLKDMESGTRKNLTISVSPPETKHLSIPSPNTSQPPSPRSPKRLFVDTPIQEEPSTSPSLLRSPESPSIPERGSSLRKHSKSPSSRIRGRKTNSNNDKAVTTTKKNASEETDVKYGSDEYAVRRTTKRIEQLKKQKEIRDRESSDFNRETSPAPENGVSRSQSLPPTIPAPNSVISTPEKPPNLEKHPSYKAHRVLGLGRDEDPIQSASLNNSPAPVPRDDVIVVQRRASVSSRKRPESTISVDYRNALEALDRLSTADAASTSSGGRHKESTTPGRRRSVGGRSAAGRRTNDTFVDRRASIGRGSSEAPPMPKPNGRWSHPDMPVKAEKRGSLKALNSPTSPDSPSREPFSEERPSSSDSIDDDVDAFLKAPRLSQKVRHPQTGRTIAFSEVGDPNGFAVFCCVGMGLTRYIAAFYDELATSLKLRVITPDRPGIGESQRYGDSAGTPLSWPEDVMTICDALGITKFSLLAHSAGAIYALATALRMPNQIRGRVHLLAPWIPPSQMSPVGLHVDTPPAGQLPKSQRILRVLPTTFLKVANSSFMSATSASVTRSVPRSPQRSKRRSQVGNGVAATNRRESFMMMDRVQPNSDSHDEREQSVAQDLRPTDDVPKANSNEMRLSGGTDGTNRAAVAAAMTLVEEERRRDYEARLTMAIWDAATTNAYPAVDLIVCLERTQPIGFRYVDVTRPVIIHHGSRDTRVPVENVKWLGRTMRKCEVRILEGEGHGLMASAVVMGNVLTEIAQEWETWSSLTMQR